VKEKQRASRSRTLTAEHRPLRDSHTLALRFVPSSHYHYRKHAISTFENALYTDKLAEAYYFRNAILVTSDYHILRSCFIMRLLIGPIIQNQRYSVYEVKEFETIWRRFIQKWRLLMLGMIKLYGTLLQVTPYPLAILL